MLSGALPRALEPDRVAFFNDLDNPCYMAALDAHDIECARRDQTGLPVPSVACSVVQSELLGVGRTVGGDHDDAGLTWSIIWLAFPAMPSVGCSKCRAL